MTAVAYKDWRIFQQILAHRTNLDGNVTTVSVFILLYFFIFCFSVTLCDGHVVRCRMANVAIQYRNDPIKNIFDQSGIL